MDVARAMRVAARATDRYIRARRGRVDHLRDDMLGEAYTVVAEMIDAPDAHIARAVHWRLSTLPPEDGGRDRVGRDRALPDMVPVGYEDGDLSPDSLTDPDADAPDPLARVRAEWDARALARVLDAAGLTDAERTAFVARIGDPPLSHGDIAMRLSVSRQRVGAILARARGKVARVVARMDERGTV
jgi:hypothetical protein